MIGENEKMTTMDNIKYCLGIWQNNKELMTEDMIEYYGIYMKKAIALYNKGLRRKDFQKMSILWDCRTVVKI